MRKQTFRVNEPAVISEEIEGEIIVLNFENGHYYSLNPSGSAVWTHLCSGAPVEQATAAVAKQFSVDVGSIAPLIEDFAERLESEHLLRREDRDPAAPLDPDGAGGEFSPPAFEKFTDMEQLLLLDPIHEVSESGWPHGPTKSGA